MSKDFNAGDVVRYPNGGLDYLIGLPGEEGLWVNACNPAWVARGERAFAEECYPFGHDDREACEVVGHYGSGSVTDAGNWYAEHVVEYAG